MNAMKVGGQFFQELPVLKHKIHPYQKGPSEDDASGVACTYKAKECITVKNAFDG
jgi:hypothetical protein